MFGDQRRLSLAAWHIQFKNTNNCEHCARGGRSRAGQRLDKVGGKRFAIAQTFGRNKNQRATKRLIKVLLKRLDRGTSYMLEHFHQYKTRDVDPKCFPIPHSCPLLSSIIMVKSC